jgi:membrane protein YdbS with pleckstrin-like domain
MEDLIYQGIQALKGGDKVTARSLFYSALEKNDQSAQAWLWLSGAVDTEEEQMECLQHVLLIDPTNAPAAKGMAYLMEKGVFLKEEHTPEEPVPEEEAPEAQQFMAHEEVSPEPTDIEPKEAPQTFWRGWEPPSVTEQTEEEAELSQPEFEGEEAKPPVTVEAEEESTSEKVEIQALLETPSKSLEMTPKVDEVSSQEEFAPESPTEMRPTAEMLQVSEGESPVFTERAVPGAEIPPVEAEVAAPSQTDFAQEIEPAEQAPGEIQAGTEEQPVTEEATRTEISGMEVTSREPVPGLEYLEEEATGFQPSIDEFKITPAEAMPVSQEPQAKPEQAEPTVFRAQEEETETEPGEAQPVAGGPEALTAPEEEPFKLPESFFEPEQAEATVFQAREGEAQTGPGEAQPVAESPEAVTTPEEEPFKLPESFFEPEQAEATVFQAQEEETQAGPGEAQPPAESPEAVTTPEEEPFKLPESFFQPGAEAPEELPDWLVGPTEEEPEEVQTTAKQPFVIPATEAFTPYGEEAVPASEPAGTGFPAEVKWAEPTAEVTGEQVLVKGRPSLVTPVLGYGLGTLIMIVILAGLLYYISTNLIANLTLLPIMGLILAIILLVFMLFMLIGVTVHHLLNSYTMTNRRLYLVEGILKARQRSIPFDRIVNIDLEQGIGQKIFRSGHIILEYEDADDEKHTVRLVDVARAKQFISIMEEARKNL